MAFAIETMCGPLISTLADLDSVLKHLFACTDREPKLCTENSEIKHLKFRGQNIHLLPLKSFLGSNVNLPWQLIATVIKCWKDKI